MNIKNWKKYALVGAFALASVAGTVGFVAAQAPNAVATAVEAHRGGGRGYGSEALAEELGITVEELQAAAEAAKEALREQAIADGWIDEDAEGRFRFGRNQYYAGIYDEAEFLADALGISVSELEAAKDAVSDAKLAEKVEEGVIDEETAEDITAVRAFKDSIDKDAILAEALGISEADLNEARNNTVMFDELLEELDLTAEEVRTNGQAIMEQLVQDAIDSGELTEAQAELLQERGGRGKGGHGGPRGGGNGGPRGGGFDGGSQETAPTGDNA